MRIALLALPLALAQTCADTCDPKTQKCVQCLGAIKCISLNDTVFTCGSTGPTTCTTDCNGAPRPLFASVQCWDGTSAGPVCEPISCTWVTSTCPIDPCNPSPCRSTEKCCNPRLGPCSTSTPIIDARYVCLPTTTCQCPDPAPSSPSYYCADGSKGGPYCQSAGGTCSWQIRDCPIDPCVAKPCPIGQTCLAPTTSLGGVTTSTDPYCVPTDRCATMVCPGLGQCSNGMCYCNATLAVMPRTQCPDGRLNPVFDNNPAVCQYVDKPCLPPVPPTCTTGQVLINTATDPVCVPDTNPCINPTTVVCAPGLTCVPDRLVPTKPVCLCTGCRDNGIRTTYCYNGRPSQICDMQTCQYVPNPDCNIPDPCSTVKCADGYVCVNMGDGIKAGPMCVPRDPCTPNPCTDANTVCRAAISVTTVTAVAGVSSFTDAKPYTCVTVPNPVPLTCDPNPCGNGGICYKTETGPVCRCQKGWAGRFCLNLDCEACSLTSTQQCRTPNAVLSTDGTIFKQSCVCNDLRIMGDACNTVISGIGSQVSPEVIVPTRDGLEGKAAVTGTTSNSFQIKGGRLDPIRFSEFSDNPLVVELDRLDVDGKSAPGPLAKGDFAHIKLCSSVFVSTKEPDLFLVDSAGLRNSKAICLEINAGATLPMPSKTFTAPNCWTFPVCHASTYAAGTPISPSANDAAVVGLSTVSVLLVFLAL